MPHLPISIYDAFSASPFGGSQGAIILNANSLSAETRLNIAKEIGVPATCFVSQYSKNSVTVRFQSPITEYPMCGHGTICLMTWLLELGILQWGKENMFVVTLNLPSTTATVEIHKHKNNQALVMLDIQAPVFSTALVDTAELADILDLQPQDYSDQWPIELASGDFIHLIVPIKTLDAMQRMTPDFGRLSQFCQKNSVQTVAAFSTETKQKNSDLHVRDFCPVVGVDESAAAGTTNAALSSYLFRHGVIDTSNKNCINILAEQGLEIGRPSLIHTVLSLSGDKISRLQVGGVAIKTMDGQLYLPD